MSKESFFINSVALARNTDGLDKYFDVKSLRRTDTFTKLALKAAAKCLDTSGLSLKEEKNIGLIISTGYGPVQKTCDFMDSIINDGDECASPLAFSGSVHNAALTQVSILLNIKGPALTVSSLETSFESALTAAKVWLNTGRCECVLLGAVDEIHTVAEKVISANPWVFEFVKNKDMGAGAAFFLISKRESVLSEPLDDILNKATPLHPSKDAFNLAVKTAPMLDKDDIHRIAADYIKTELARAGHDIMGVFGSCESENLLDKAEPELRDKILSGLNCLLSGENKMLLAKTEDIDKNCYELFKEHRLINFYTSGSTGVIKNCLHSEKEVKEEAIGVSGLFKGVKRIITTVPSSHSYGFIFGLQLPKVIAAPLEVKPPVPVLAWGEILKEGDLFIAFPMFLKQLDSIDFKFPKGVTVLTSTAPCPDELIERLYKNGLMRLIEIYGASESGAIGWREKAGEGFKLLPFWNGEIKDGKLERISRKENDLSVELPDIVEVGEDGRFKPVGRKDNAVQVAGINVYPQKVERILKNHKAVSEAAVRLMRPDEGERLKAFIVLNVGFKAADIIADLRVFMRRNLSMHEIPRSLSFGAKIPVTDYGKKKDW
ncbi:4-coumarate--CoA ligase [Parelusimicrobium proximum]|uniref:beta-ketoacyl synthase N-terminal-like domain-containing protein n=1 Tax=Parelusimicrobium proximum TaxID=3228953 RepID=UPI003D16375D